MKHIYIYGLVDPELNLIKYVGATNDLAIRYQSHLSDTTTNKTKKAEWIRSLSIKNMKPYLVLLETTSEENAASCELKWAETYKPNDLYNFFPIKPYSSNGGKSELISLRLGHNVIYDLKNIAGFTGVKYQTLIKRWIDEKIETFK